MQIQVNYQGLDHTPWMDQFITRRVSKLNRYFTPSANVVVHLKFTNRLYVTNLAIHNGHKDYAFNGEGENLYESFSQAIDRATRVLGEEKRKIKDKINKRFFSLRELAT